MTRWPLAMAIGCGITAMGWATTRGATITYHLTNPGPTIVTAGVPFDLEIRATFDAPLVATQYSLRATGTPVATMTARSQNPVGPAGLSYVSATSQDPFESGLPFDVTAATLKEVAYDADFGDDPGGPFDGVPSNPSPPGELLDTITLVATGTGSLTLTMSSAYAATTQGAPDGVMFGTVTIGTPSVVLTVQAPPGDWDTDGDVDLTDFAQFAGCLSGPAGGDGFVAPSAQCLQVFDIEPDASPDGDVDLNDFAVFQEVFTGQR